MPTDPPDRFAVILGTNEIASAVAVSLHRSSYRVVLSHDPLPPVIRRKMAFHDALFDDAVSVAGVPAQRADTGFEIRTRLGRTPGVVITDLGLLDLIVLRSLDILVDARMQKYLATPDLRRLARLTIGLGPGFAAAPTATSPSKPGRTRRGRLFRMGRLSRPTAFRVGSGIVGMSVSFVRNSLVRGRQRSKSARVSSRISSSAVSATHRCVRLSTESCGASSATAPKYRPASSFWKSIPEAARRTGPASTAAAS